MPELCLTYRRSTGPWLATCGISCPTNDLLSTNFSASRPCEDSSTHVVIEVTRNPRCHAHHMHTCMCKSCDSGECPLPSTLAATCRTMQELPASTELAQSISKTLKKRGFKFVGPTMVYAMMQAAGVAHAPATDSDGDFRLTAVCTDGVRCMHTAASHLCSCCRLRQ
jgi:hypothetical protein